MSDYSVIRGLEPQSVFRYFCDLSDIPRVPGKQQQVSDFICAFARDLGLDYEQDDYLNVIIRKPASPGYEDSPSVMLQAHMDMICEKDPDVEHDFEKDPLVLFRDGDKIRAKGTTLGADNGVGCAFMMSILADKSLCHPELECVFTTDEETDMGGAVYLRYSSIRSKTIINLDEGAVKIGHTGTIMIEMRHPVEFSPASPETETFRITVSGLIGGHTGLNALLERGNAIVLLNRVLLEIHKKLGYELYCMDGGLKTPSAFARDAYAVIGIKKEHSKALEDIVASFDLLFKRELTAQDPNVQVSLTSVSDAGERILSPACADLLRNFLLVLPDGIFSRDKRFENGFESASNIGILRTGEEGLYIALLVRASTAAKKYYLYDKVIALSETCGFSHHIARDIPHWEETRDERILGIVKEVYPDRIPEICHPTLECGIFAKNIPDASIIVLGPQYYNAHSPLEYFLISETKYFYDRLLSVLEKLK